MSRLRMLHYLIHIEKMGNKVSNQRKLERIHCEKYDYQTKISC